MFLRIYVRAMPHIVVADLDLIKELNNLINLPIIWLVVGIRPVAMQGYKKGGDEV